MAIVLNRHYETGREQFSEQILDQLVEEKQLQYESGQTGRCSYQNLRKSASWVHEMYHTGSIRQGKIPNRGQREPVQPFKTLLQDFCDGAKQSMAETSLNTARSAIRRFLFEMEDHGFRSLADFSQIT